MLTYFEYYFKTTGEEFMKNYCSLTNEEAINLVILALKLSGYNNNLIADGKLGKEAKTAAKNFLNDFKSNIVMETLSAMDPSSHLVTGTYLENRLKEFFAENDCPLD